MKRIRLLLITVLLLTAGSFSGTILAQEDKDANEDKQREEELLKAIGEQKKALQEQRRAQEEATREIEENMRELEKLRDYNFDIDIDESGDNVRVYRRGRSVNPDVWVVPEAPVIPEVPNFYIGSHGFVGIGTGSGTSWEFTKSVKEDSFKKEYAFDVDNKAKTVSMAINGDCKAGEIRIKVLTPQGKTYSDVVIDEYGNINVRKSFNISETENKDKLGEWKFLIDSDNATGYFKISFQTY